MEDNPDTPQAVAAISTLIEYINQLHSGKNLHYTKVKKQSISSQKLFKFLLNTSPSLSFKNGCQLFSNDVVSTNVFFIKKTFKKLLKGYAVSVYSRLTRRRETKRDEERRRETFSQSCSSITNTNHGSLLWNILFLK